MRRYLDRNGAKMNGRLLWSLDTPYRMARMFSYTLSRMLLFMMPSRRSILPTRYSTTCPICGSDCCTLTAHMRQYSSILSTFRLHYSNLCTMSMFSYFCTPANDCSALSILLSTATDSLIGYWMCSRYDYSECRYRRLEFYLKTALTRDR